MDVDKLLQYLIPLIFLVVWAIGKIFSPKRTEEEAETSNTGKRVPEAVDKAFEEIFGLDVEEEGRSPEGKGRSFTQAEKTTLSPTNMHHANQYPGDSLARLRDIRSMKNSSIMSELSSSSDIKRAKQNSEIRMLLKGPHALRKAFLACEILGPPLCLRKNGKVGRSWQR